MRIRPTIHAREPWVEPIKKSKRKPNFTEIEMCLSCEDYKICKYGTCKKIKNLRRRK